MADQADRQRRGESTVEQLVAEMRRQWQQR